MPTRRVDNRVLPGTRAERRFDAAIWLTPIVPLLIVAPLVGRPHLLIGPLLPLGPLALGAALAGGRNAGRQHRSRAIEFAFSIGCYAVIVWTVLSLGARYASLSILLPVGAIMLLVLAVNWALFTVIAANRARYGELFDPPGVIPLPQWLRGGPRTDTSASPSLGGNHGKRHS